MTDLTIKRINKHSKKYRSIPLLTCDRFLDFKISSDFLNVFNVSERKYKIVSVSGQSGVGKSITMNIIITLLYNNFQKENKEIGKDIRYVEIFKVGDGMEGETSGVNCNIINIDDKNGILILDLQGNNDKKNEKNWKYLYYSIFSFSFLISDFHFFFYSGNVENIQNYDIITIINKKQKMLEKKNGDIPRIWSHPNELILVNNKIDDITNPKILEKYEKSHLEKAKKTYSKEYFKEKIYCISKNDHFNTLNDHQDRCLGKNFVCNLCQKKRSYGLLNEISRYILSSHDDVARDNEVIKDDLNEILKEMQRSRYYICYQSNLNINNDEMFIKEYLENVKDLNNKQKERINNFQFRELFVDLLNNQNYDKEKFEFLDKMIKNFANIYLVSLEFSRFIDKNLFENGNDILRKEEANYFEDEFYKDYKENIDNFVKILNEYSIYEKNKKNIQFYKIIKEKLSQIYLNIKGEKNEKIMQKKFSFWQKVLNFFKLFIGANVSKTKTLIYLLFSISSIEKIIENQSRITDHFESVYVICGLKYMEWLISEDNVTLIQELAKKVQNLVKDLKDLIDELKVKVITAGFMKNKQIIAILRRIQKLIDDFLNQKNNGQLQILISEY